MIDDGYPIVEKFTAGVGVRVGKLVMLEKRPPRSGKTYWLCQCDCGNQKEVRQDNLSAGARGLKGGTRSCGCKQSTCFINPNKGLKHEDCTGQILNSWKLIKKTNILDSNRSIMYLCQSVLRPDFYDLLSIRHLKDGAIAQAKLANKKYNEIQLSYREPKNLSKNEQRILDMLKKANIHGKMQGTYEKCKNKNVLPFDFIINGNKDYIIEYDGKQHFKVVEHFGGEEGLNIRRAHDFIKNKYCFDNNIPLIRIPYDADYTIDDLKLETTRFLLTPENEEKYYSLRA